MDLTDNCAVPKYGICVPDSSFCHVSVSIMRLRSRRTSRASLRAVRNENADKKG